MESTQFLRLLWEDDKASALSRSIAALRKATAPNGYVFTMDSSSFGAIPGSPFSYWVSARVRSLFSRLPPFGSDGRIVRVGLQTSEDFRFVRAWWEVPAESIVSGTEETTPEEFREQTFKGKRWVPFAKGGAYSPFYADIHLVVNWENGGQEIKSTVNEAGKVRSNVWMLRETEARCFFHPGITWPVRTNGLSFRLMPSGVIFGHKGPAAFAANDTATSLMVLNGLLNSRFVDTLVSALVARVSLAQSFDVGLIETVPVPRLSLEQQHRISHLATDATQQARQLDITTETSHAFLAPALLLAPGAALTERVDAWNVHAGELLEQFTALRSEIDRTALDVYGLSTDATGAAQLAPEGPTDEGDAEETNEELETPTNQVSSAEDLAFALVSYALGCVFGRWDMRGAKDTGGMTIDPFAPLAICSPGMLQDQSGAPALASPEGYPIRVQWDSILADDPGHPSDVVTRVLEVLHTLLPNVSDVESELCGALGVKDFRSWFSSRFFTSHIKQYTKSKRKAPIYWALQSSGKSYTLWFYYPRLTRDTVYVALRDYIEPKITHELEVLETVRDALKAGRTGRAAGQQTQAKQVEAQESLVQELRAFQDEIRSAVEAGYDPDHNDGALINIAPFHRLVAWKDAAVAYKGLKTGQYDWATLHRRYRFPK